jgi:outer membrane protein TolC
MRSFLLPITCITVFFCLAQPLKAQQPDLNYFIDRALRSDVGIRQNINQQQTFSLQSQLIIAQNKKPQVNFTSDYTFVPYFGGGRLLTLSPNPPDGSFGYDPALTNGGLYASQINVAYNLFNKATINGLQAQNNNLAAINSNNKAQLEHDVRKAITDQYLQVYLQQQLEEYLQLIITEINGRRPAVEALVKHGLLQQSDYLLLEIELNTRENDISQAKIQPPVILLNANPQGYYYTEKFKLDSLALVAQQNVFNNKYRPQLNLAANAGLYTSDITNAYHNVGMQAGLHLNIPIYDGKQRQINDSFVKISQQNIVYARDNFTLQQKNYLQSLRKQIELFNLSTIQMQQMIGKQELLLRLDREKLQGGQLSIIEYVKSLQDYAAAKQALTASRVQILLLANQFNYYNW